LIIPEEICLKIELSLTISDFTRIKRKWNYISEKQKELENKTISKSKRFKMIQDTSILLD